MNWVQLNQAQLLFLLDKLGINIDEAMRNGGMFLHKDGSLYVWQVGMRPTPGWLRVMSPTETDVS